MGTAEDCDPNPCDNPHGSCCVGSDCYLTTEQGCADLGGSWTAGGACDPNPCPGGNGGDSDCACDTNPALIFPRSLFLDFGAGGWTNAGCHSCTEIAGEFRVETESLCVWGYDEELFCRWGGQPTGSPFTLSLYGGFGYDGYGDRWRFHVRIWSPEVSTYYSYAIFNGPANSCYLPATLTKVADVHNGDYWHACWGDLPNTITLSAS
jgi:hypothetical protein